MQHTKKEWRCRNDFDSKHDYENFLSLFKSNVSSKMSIEKHIKHASGIRL